MVDLNNYCVIIPVYNDNKRLKTLINKILEVVPLINIYIIDDGSRDAVRTIENTTIIRHNLNLGKGEAIKTGIKRANKEGFKFAIFMDADLQHDPKKIPAFINAQQQYNADMVIGRRNFNTKNMPMMRYLSNRITSKLVTLRTSRKIFDCQCGYRLIKLQDLEISKFRYTGFQFESEFIIKYLLMDRKVVEVEIPTIYSQEKSSINHIPDTLKFIKLYFNSFLWKKERKN